MVRRRTYRKVLEGMSVIHQRFTSKLKFLRSNEKEHSVGTGGPSAVGGGRRLLSGLVSSSPGLRRSGAAMGLGGTVRSSDLAHGGEDPGGDTDSDLEPATATERSRVCD